MRIARPRFLELVLVKDHKALVLLAYWLVILAQVPLWWVKQRGRCESQAICFYLAETSTDMVVDKFMEWPRVMLGVTGEVQ